MLGKDKKLCSDDSMIDLFRKKIVRCDFSKIRSLKYQGLDCIVRLFYLVNETQKNVEDLEPAQESSTSWQWNQTSEDTSQKSVAKRFRVAVPPQELEGISTLWTLLRTCSTDSESLLKLIQTTLINVYTNLDPLLESQAQAINDSFIQECLNCINSLHSEDNMRSQQETSGSLKCIS
jgi:hypothetical protein